MFIRPRTAIARRFIWRAQTGQTRPVAIAGNRPGAVIQWFALERVAWLAYSAQSGIPVVGFLPSSLPAP